MTESPEPDAATLVTLLYRALLGREPDVDGLRNHVLALETRRVTLQALARAFTESDEFRGRVPAGGQSVAVRAFDCDFILPAGAEVIGELASPEGYEPWVLPYFLDHCRPGMTVLDIGASWGAFALPAARRVGPGGKVWAVEVSAANCRVLMRSARASGLDNVSILPLGVSDRFGAELLRRQDVTNNNAIDTGVAVEDGALDSYDVVPVLPLDLVRGALGPVHIVKMDIEGMEYRAALGALALLRDQRPLVFSEYSPRFQQLGSGVDGAQLLGLFLDLGYEIEVLHRHQPRERIGDRDPVAAVARVDAAWRAHVVEDGGTHLDLCLHPTGRAS